VYDSLEFNVFKLSLGDGSVGAASSRDFAIMALGPLIFEAGSRSREKLMLSQ
jgi:hypothetical protein